MSQQTFEEVLGSPEFQALEAVYAERLPGWHETERNRFDQTTVRSEIRNTSPAELLGASLRLLLILEFYFRPALEVRRRARRPGRGVQPNPFLYAADMELKRETYAVRLKGKVPHWLQMVGEQQDCALRVSVGLDFLAKNLLERFQEVPRWEPLVHGLIFSDAKALQKAIEGIMASKALRSLFHPFDQRDGKDNMAASVRLALAEMYANAAPVRPSSDEQLVRLGFDAGTLDVLIRAGRFANGPDAECLSADGDQEFAFVVECLTGLLGNLPLRARCRLVDDIRKFVRCHDPLFSKAEGDSESLEKEVGDESLEKEVGDWEPPQAVVEFVENIEDVESLDATGDKSESHDCLEFLESLKTTNPTLYKAVGDVISNDGKYKIGALAKAAGVSREALYKRLRRIRAAWQLEK